MKFIYTHITENTIEKTIYKISKDNKINTNQIRLSLDNINVNK